MPPGVKNPYNLHMDRNKALTAAQHRASLIWDMMAETHPRLVRFDVPEIILCGRLTATAGMCFAESRRIKLGWKFITHSAEYRGIMFNEILPHELMHQIDFDLFGASELKCGHGKNWQMLMIQYGLKPEKYHKMSRVK